MLQDIRDKAQGWIAWVIVILISVPFALWGIQEYLGIGAEPVVATVNGNEITERSLDQQFQNFRQNLRQQLGAAYRPELFDDERMRKEVLNQLVREDVILQSSRKMGLRSGDVLVRETILGIEAFKKNGKFDQETYERAVRLQGVTSAGFEERLRRILLSDQLSQAVSTSAFVTEHELKEALRLGNQTRKVDYFILASADFTADEAISDEDIQAYFEQHQNNYRSPEQVKLEYILLNADVVGRTVEVDDATLQGFYDGHQELYGLPEQRQASHILIMLDQDADQTSVNDAREKLAALRLRAEQGEDFAELAKANSQDPGSAANGGDLGYFGKGIMDPAFEQAVFSLQEDGLSEPVRSSFGFHLIKLTGIKQGSVKPFEQVRAEVEQAYRKGEGEQLYIELAEQLADLSYEDPTSLEPAADALGLEIIKSDWIGRNGGVGVLKSPKVMAAAFAEDVLVEHNNSELIELDQEQSIVLRVVDHKESSTLALEEVKEAILASIKRERSTELAKAEAEARLARLEAGETIDQVAGKYEIKSQEALKRNDKSVPFPLLSQVFRSQRPAAGQSVSGITRLAGDDYAVFSLHMVQDGSFDDLDETAKEQEQKRLRSEFGRKQFDQLVADLEARADISYIKVSEDE